MTGIHRDTVMRLGVRMGEGCQALMDEKLRNLDSRLIEVDEVWGFIGMKKKTAHRINATGAVGDVWTWVALDAETKLVPAFAVGARSQYMANSFMENLASRLSHRVQISSDALRAYEGAIERAFGAEVGLRLNYQNLFPQRSCGTTPVFPARSYQRKARASCGRSGR